MGVTVVDPLTVLLARKIIADALIASGSSSSIALTLVDLGD